MQKLLILSTGGTLDKVYFDALSDFQVGAPVAQEIVAAMNVAFEIEALEVCKKDSLEITDQDREDLLASINQSNSEHILITHGTDTMVDTAQYIAPMIIDSQKVVILTGAMQPAAFKDSDAVFNIGCAVGAMAIAAPGVYIAMSGRVYKAGDVFKNYDSRRFENIPAPQQVQ